MTQLLYISGSVVADLLPSISEQMGLAEEAYLVAARGELTLPPKTALHPRPTAFNHAMPVYIAGHDILALKWIGGNQLNPARNLPNLTGLVILNDPETGVPTAILDCAAITAARTAAASALSADRLALPGWRKVAIIGLGVQGRAHLDAFRHLQPDAEFVVYRGRHSMAPGEGFAVAASAAEAAANADVVISTIPLSSRLEPRLEAHDIRHDALVLPVDYSASVAPSVVSAARLFVVDDRSGYESASRGGHFAGWRSPEFDLGSVLSDEGFKRPSGLAVVCNLGVGSLDALFADHIASRARDLGRGVILPESDGIAVRDPLAVVL